MSKWSKIVASSLLVSTIFTGTVFADLSEDKYQLALENKSVISYDNIDKAKLYKNMSIKAFLKELIIIDGVNKDDLTDGYIHDYGVKKGYIEPGDKIEKNLSKAKAAKIINKYTKRITPVKFEEVDNVLPDVEKKMEQMPILIAYTDGILGVDLCNRFSPDTLISYNDGIMILKRLMDEDERLIPNMEPAKKMIYKNETIKLEEHNVIYDIIQGSFLDSDLDMKVGLVDSQLCKLDTMKSIADKEGAIAGINGTYFNIYSQDKKNYGLIVKNGRVLHSGNNRPAFGFDSNGNMDISIVKTDVYLKSRNLPISPVLIEDALINDSSKNEEKYNTIYTPEYSRENKIQGGMNVVVKRNRIMAITKQAADIPINGFVYNYVDKEKDKLFNLLPNKIDSELDYEVRINPLDGNAVFWKNIQGALGGLDILVYNSEVSDGLEQKPMANYRIPRSALGFTVDKQIIFINSDRATLKDMAIELERLGCMKGMSLSFGLSSSMFYRGIDKDNNKRIANGLFIVEKK